MAEWSMQRVDEQDPAQIELVRELFREYQDWLGTVICSSRLAEEIESLPGPYSQPAGVLYLATNAEGRALGVFGVRPHDKDTCEIKRLYVRSETRGSGLGRELLVTALEEARRLGYRRAVVTTLPKMMPVAAGMYERLGFEQVEPFVDHSHVGEGVEMAYLSIDL